MAQDMSLVEATSGGGLLRGHSNSTTSVPAHSRCPSDSGGAQSLNHDFGSLARWQPGFCKQTWLAQPHARIHVMDHGGDEAAGEFNGAAGTATATSLNITMHRCIPHLGATACLVRVVGRGAEAMALVQHCVSAVQIA